MLTVNISRDQNMSIYLCIESGTLIKRRFDHVNALGHKDCQSGDIIVSKVSEGDLVKEVLSIDHNKPIERKYIVKNNSLSIIK